MPEHAAGLKQCLQAIRSCEARYQRRPQSVQLIAVSKRQSADAIRAAYAAGQLAFGENYLGEALDKQALLADLPLQWHFIGSIQSNKTAEIAQHFSWVHTVDRDKIARRLNDQRPAELVPLKVLIQVNISGEDSKSGVAPASLAALIATIKTLPRLKLCGLMALPAPSMSPAEQQKPFRALAELADNAPVALPELSMGTSQDYEAAIAAGATMIRLGTAIFGPRSERA